VSKVLVKYRGHLAALTGAGEETLEALNVKGALRSLRERHGREAEKAARTMIIALNGESILLLRRYKTILKEGDVLSFFPLCAGG
jgi:molybdopterin synthase sulfur carrier subunit